MLSDDEHLKRLESDLHVVKSQLASNQLPFGKSDIYLMWAMAISIPLIPLALHFGISRWLILGCLLGFIAIGYYAFIGREVRLEDKLNLARRREFRMLGWLLPIIALFTAGISHFGNLQQVPRTFILAAIFGMLAIFFLAIALLSFPAHTVAGRYRMVLYGSVAPQLAMVAVLSAFIKYDQLMPYLFALGIISCLSQALIMQYFYRSYGKKA